MAMQPTTLVKQSRPPSIVSLVDAITSTLRTLNPHDYDSSHVSPQALDQFLPYLKPKLVVRVIKDQSNPYHALFFFNWASNLNPNPFNYSHTHHCFLAITDLLLFHSLFSTASLLLQKHNRLSDFMVGKFIKACGDRGDLRGAISWFHRAKSNENGRCLFSYNSILGVMVRANRMNLARAFYDQILKEGVVKPDVSTYTTMIRGYCKLGMIKDAKKMFDEMSCEPNLLTYNIIIDGFCKKGDLDSARMIFKEMVDGKACLPDTVTYTTLIDGYCKNGSLEEAVKCMDEMVRGGCEPNPLTYNALINGLSLSGNVDEAKKMMTKMRLNGLRDNLATHTSILKGLCKVGKSEEAVSYLKEMISLGFEPDVKSYGVVVNEYCNLRKPDEAISLLKEVRSRGLNPSVSSFNAVLRILVENGEHERAITFLKKMPQMGCAPNFISYNTVICSLCRIRGMMPAVESLTADMVRDGHLLDATMYGCIIMGYCADGNDRMGLQVFYESINRDHVIGLESFSVLVNELCRKGKVREAEAIFEDMCRKCHVVDVNSYRRALSEHLCLHSSTN